MSQNNLKILKKFSWIGKYLYNVFKPFRLEKNCYFTADDNYQF